MRPAIHVVSSVLLLSTTLGLAQVGAGPARSLVAAEAKLEKLAGGFSFTEGATCAPNGDVFFVDQPSNRILRWNVREPGVSVFMDPAGRANGMCFDASGNLIACADETNALWSIAPDKQIRVLAHEFEGKPLNGPNDVWVHPNGAIYLTDPYYQRSWWTHKKPPQDGEHVYRLSPDRRRLERVADDLVKPNGITGTPDGQHVFVADIGAGRIYAYDLQPDGTLAGKRLFCEARSDGMTLDDEGNLYTTSNGVLIFDKTGRHVETIDVPERWTANVCFGGQDRRTLFVTASKGLYSIRMRTKGANPGK